MPLITLIFSEPCKIVRHITAHVKIVHQSMILSCIVFSLIGDSNHFASSQICIAHVWYALSRDHRVLP